MRNVLFILFGLFIDGFQAFMSLGLMALSGTIATIAPIAGIGLGAAVGLIIGGIAVGGVCILTAGAGCIAVAIGGAASGAVILGTAGGVVIGTATSVLSIPMGIVLGIAINFCISASFGVALIAFLGFNGMVYPKYWFGGIGEAIPGINNIPFWTALVVLCLLKKSAEESGGSLAKTSGLLTGIMSPGGTIGKATSGVMNMKEQTTDIKNSAEIEEKPEQKTRQIFTDIHPVKKAAFVFALMLSLSASTALAQTEPVRFLISPEIPGPYETVRIEVQGIGTFLGDAAVTWQKDGETVLTGVGERVFTFATGAVGEAVRVTVTIDSSIQGKITRTFTFIPAVVNLVWEADTTTPAMYRGKALYSAGSTLRVMALPQVVANGATVSANNLSFQWTINNEPAPSLSGKGRSTITFKGSQLRAGESVEVDVYFGDVPVAQGSLFVPAIEPRLLVYIQDPLRGTLYDQALPTTVLLSGREITLKAEPYYFAQESLVGGTLSYDWTLGGEKTAGPESAAGILTLRQTGEGVGQTNLGISLQNIDPTKFVQTAETALYILFGQQSEADTSLFGI